MNVAHFLEHLPPNMTSELILSLCIDHVFHQMRELKRYEVRVVTSDTVRLIPNLVKIGGP